MNKSYNLRLPVDLMLKLFDQLVSPILLYGCEVWGFEDLKQIESFHLHFCKQILKLKKSTPNCMIYGELGRHKLAKTIEHRMISFWGGIVNGDNNKLSPMMFKYLRVLHERDIYSSPWILKVKSIFEKTGMPFIWNTANYNVGENLQLTATPNQTWLKKTIDRRLSDIYMQEWCTEVNNNGQCKVYRIFKKNLKFENYLINLPLYIRLHFCRIRCSNSKIPSISGRYQNTVFHERICTLCDQEKLGDEFHYFFECPTFSQVRNNYIAPYFCRNPNTLKMEKLFQSKSKKTLRNVSLFCGEILKRF